MKVSRSKVELFAECPRCFYLDVMLGIKRPPGYPFSLNNAVDALLKKEFDQYRSRDESHPLLTDSGLGWKPAREERLEKWRDAFAGGLAYEHQEHGCTYYGAIDDLWINEQGEYAVADYKATAGLQPVAELPAWANGYRRQLSFYAWLLARNGLRVANKGFLVYATASTARERFDNKLAFDLRLVPVDLDITWIEPTLDDLQAVLKQEQVPNAAEDCKYCKYSTKLKEI